MHYSNFDLSTSTSSPNWLKKSNGILVNGKHAKFIFPPHDKFQLSDYIRNPDYDKRIFDYLRSTTGIRKNVFFVDVGANVGTHSIYALKESGISHAYCIEPLQSNLFYLNLNLKINDLHDKATIIPYAIGDKTQSTTLHINPINCGDNRLIPRTKTIRHVFVEKNFKKETILLKKFDHFIDEYCIASNKIGVLWMDVQGAEGLILNYSNQIKSNLFPIFIEFWPYGMKALNSYPSLHRFIEKHVKKILRINKKEFLSCSLNELEDYYTQKQDDGYSVENLMLIR
jgi:FkbM family methyltransferase